MMTIEQTRSELIRLRQQRPFVPFTVVTTRGERLEVPEQLAIAIGGHQTVIVPDGKSSVYLLLKEIDRIEVAEHAA
ncbi:MAG TPA: hypothetical protein PKB10_15440 [Tepidisphaeraceae bacterium]|nr:hypothetical protein [Tepidisphaeraceae bacterium]